jgi:hypothetical protein
MEVRMVRTTLAAENRMTESRDTRFKRFSLASFAAVLITGLLTNPIMAKTAQVVSVTHGGVDYVTHTVGTNGINAEIGRWDTPYPYPDTGEPAPGLEPDGASTLSIDVDVNDGGIVSFSYQFLTYDAGIYDWLDIYLLTPDSTVALVSQLGKPGGDYGDYWQSALITLTQPLEKWRNQRVTFVFSVQQDGYGDQSAARLYNFAVRSCVVPPLTEITDTDALHFENVDPIDEARLTSAMKTALSCLRQQVAGVSGTLTVTSAYRPPPYQQHLREVWDRWNDLRNLRDPDCEGLRAQVQQEFLRHKLKLAQRPASASGQHTQGQAFDAGWTLPSGTTIDVLAAHCNLRRPIVKDPPHFVHN